MRTSSRWPMMVGLLLLLAVPAAQARWGETYDDCVKRYGKPTLEKKDDAGRPQLAEFEVEGVIISATFKEGIATSVQYGLPEHQPLSTAQMVTVLELYESEHVRFQPVAPFDPDADDGTAPEQHRKNLENSVKYQSWIRSDGKLVAVWIRDSGALMLYSAPDVQTPAGGGKL